MSVLQGPLIQPAEVCTDVQIYLFFHTGTNNDAYLLVNFRMISFHLTHLISHLTAPGIASGTGRAALFYIGVSVVCCLTGVCSVQSPLPPHSQDGGVKRCPHTAKQGQPSSDTSHNSPSSVLSPTELSLSLAEFALAEGDTAD